MSDINKIIEFLDEYIDKSKITHLTPIEANRLLEQAGLLDDSKSRPGKPLRILLRKGLISHAYQPTGQGSNWFIPHSQNIIDQNNIAEDKRNEINAKINGFNAILDQLNNARQKYKPKKIKCLFIGEAPPDSLDRFFYFEDVKKADELFLGIMENLYPELKDEYLASGRPTDLKERILLKFKYDGFYLLDVSELPLDLLDGELASEVPYLIQRLEKTISKHTPVILIKATTFDVAHTALINKGYKKCSSIRIPFPDQDNQAKFREEFSEALKIL